jgi:hypothetical protein
MLGEIELALKRLPKWMKDEGRSADASLFFKPMSEHIVAWMNSDRMKLRIRAENQKTAKRCCTGKLVRPAHPGEYS